MRQTTGHLSYMGSAGGLSLYGLCPPCCTRRRRPGFTLIEVVVAMAIMMIVMIGILSTISYAYTASTRTEQLDIARRIASYTVEYLRARTVTRGSSDLTTTLGITSSSAGTYGWYRSSTDPSPNTAGAFPSMIDTENLPIQSDGKPCNFLAAYVEPRSNNVVDGTLNQGATASNNIQAVKMPFQFSSMHPALPAETYGVLAAARTPSDYPASYAWTSTLQGYVSVRNRLPNDVTGLTATQNPAPEDVNLARMLDATTNDANGRYRTTLTDLTSAGAWTGLIVQYPGVYPAAPPAMTITSFTPLTGYVAKVYTTDPNKMLKSNQEYNPYYTNVATGTQAYRGFRVLTQVIARTADRTAYNHVQYYDVQVTVFWVTGTRESQYGLTTQIIAY